MFGKKKILLDPDQEDLIECIAREVNVPQEEVLWLFVEFGQLLCHITQNEGGESVVKLLEIKENNIEYENWKAIAAKQWEIFSEGVETIKKDRAKNENNPE